MVERAVGFANFYHCNSDRPLLALRYKIYYAMDTWALDLKVYRFFSFIYNFSIDDMVLSWWVTIYAKNNNLHCSCIYNSYGSIVHEIVTIKKSNACKS